MNAWLFLAALLVGTMATMDHLAPVPESPDTRSGRSLLVGPPGRLFVLLLDSLRWETAMNPAIMPRLAALRSEGAFGKFIPSRDAVTVPALRVAFSGRERTSLFGFVENLRHRDGGVESLFSEAHAAGLRVVAYSDGSFDQFGSGNLEHLANTRVDENDKLGAWEHTTEVEVFRDALDDFRSGRHDVVVAHLTYTDHASHELMGTTTSRYAAFWRGVDELVAAAAETVRSDETLVVMGDHGHDMRGDHLLGLDVPTAGVYRGPAYRAGVDLGTLSNAAHRYLASAGLHLAVAPTAIARPVQALAPPIDPEYLAPAPPQPAAGIPAERRSGALALAALVAVLGIVWAALLLVPVSWPAVVAAWLAAAPLAAPALLPWGALAGAVAGLAWLAAVRPWSIRPAASVVVAAVAVGVALLFYAYGANVLNSLPMLHPRPGVIAVWLGVLAVACVIARRWGAGVASWGVLAATLFLLPPTLYEYGAPGAMGPAWLVWLAVQLVPRRGRPLTPSRAQLVLFLSAALIVSQFCMPDARSFVFYRWKLSAARHVPHWWNLLALASLAIVFVDPGRRLRRVAIGARSLVVGLAAAAAVTALHSGYYSLGRTGVACAALLAIAGALLRAPAWHDLRRMAWLAAGLVAIRALIDVPPESYLWADAFLALVLLSADLACVTSASSAPSRQAFLLVMGALAVGWSLFTWSISRLEWHFLYAWLGAEYVERSVPLLLPLILARFAIPLALVRFVLAERFGDATPPVRVASLFGGAKALTVVLVAAGAGWVSVETDVYLSAAHQAAVWLVVLLGLGLHLPARARPVTVLATTAPLAARSDIETAA